jgi:hypothetical protein
MRGGAHRCERRLIRRVVEGAIVGARNQGGVAGIHVGRYLGHAQKPGGLRRACEPARRLGIVKRLETEPIAGDPQRPARLVVESECKVAVQPGERAGEAVPTVKERDRLTVARRHAAELGGKVCEIEDLAI